MAEKRKKRRNQRGKTHILRARSFQGIFPLFPHLDLHFGKNVVFYSVSRIFCRGLVAQSVEHRPFKAGVQGSSPCQLTFFVSSFLIFSAFPGIPFFPRFKNKKGFARNMQTREDQNGGGGWIRTIEGMAGRFTVYCI